MGEGKGKYYPQVVLQNKKLLLDDTYSDLILKVGSDVIQAHAAIVCCRCTEILGPPSMDERSKKKTKKIEVKMKDGAVTAHAMTKVLEFLYTGMVDFPKLSDKEIIFLVKAARHFKLDRLSYLCERWLNEHMTIESVFHLLKAATDLDESRIKGFCLQFALKNYNDFIANKDGIYILGIELFQEVVAAFQTNPSPPASIYPDGGPPDTLLEDFKRLYETMPYSDLTVTCGGDYIKCHKALLTAYSDNLASALIKDSDTPLSISAEAFRNVLKFSYYGNDEVNPIPACDLVAFCRRHKLPTLMRICEDKIRTSINKDTVVAILGVSYLPAEGKQDLVDELQSKCYPFILQNLDTIDLSMVKAFNPLMTIDLLLKLQTAVKSNEFGLGCIQSGDGAAAAPRSAPGVKRSQPPPPPARMMSGGAVSDGDQSSSSDNRPAPPPRSGTRAPPGGLPPPVVGDRPPPPPRDTAPPPLVTSVSTSELQSEESESSEKASRLTRKKSLKNVSSELKDAKKPSRKEQKEEEKRKKEELKRIAKERKERQKMEKKFKGKGDIY